MNKSLLIEMPARKLLEQFGAGRPTPGAGSASAMNAIISGEMSKSVCKICIGKPNYLSKRSLLNSMISDIEFELNRLYDLFQRDSDAFLMVMNARNLVATGVDVDLNKNEELKYLSETTKIVLDIADISLKFFSHAKFCFDEGVKHVRGDSSVALSSAQASCLSSYATASLNLSKISKNQDIDLFMVRMNKLNGALSDMSKECFERIMSVDRRISGRLYAEVQHSFSFGH